jgi:hypothetical protein
VTADILRWKRPSYCHFCGTPYPWTVLKLEAAKEMAEELDELSPEEKEKLKDSLDDLTVNTPKTNLAVTRTKKLLGKLTDQSFSIFKNTLQTMVTEYEVDPNLKTTGREN